MVVRIRYLFAERVRKLLPEEEAQLGLSYLLGMKTGLDDEFAEKLRTVGLTHIVVASGAHLAILVEVAKKLSKSVKLTCTYGYQIFNPVVEGHHGPLHHNHVVVGDLTWKVNKKNVLRFEAELDYGTSGIQLHQRLVCVGQRPICLPRRHRKLLQRECGLQPWCHSPAARLRQAARGFAVHWRCMSSSSCQQRPHIQSYNLILNKTDN